MTNFVQSDGVAKYIDWACNNDFGVIDINVPHYITRTDDTEHFTPRMDEKTLQMHLQELMCYIWDNYLQLYDGADEIYLMGVGNAYLGIKVLLINRSEYSPPYLTTTTLLTLIQTSATESLA